MPLPYILRPLAVAALASTAAMQPAHSEEAAVSFGRDIRPILSNHCFKCHGPDEHERKGGKDGSGGLRLDTEAGALADLGGKAAIVPGDPEKSDLLARIVSTDPDDVMPPPKSGGALSAGEAKLLREWIQSGAKYSRHWSYEKPVRPPLPRQTDNPVDAFVLERLEKEHLTPQPEADRAALIRRVSLDLTGLPPSLAEVDAFLADAAPRAYERLVDRLLASPAYGEHWARLWLDLARYADSAGYADDPPRTIWAYRDYVIRSFNANKPFDQFTIEQIAGDLLPSPAQEQLVATAFHRNTMTNSEGGTNDEEFRNAAVVDRVNTTMAVWMGTSMTCAQCHTHKYDPITQSEYFQFFDFFNQTADADQKDETPVLTVLPEDQKAQRTKLDEAAAALEHLFAHPSAELQSAAAAWASRFPPDIHWTPLIPSTLSSQAGLPMQTDSDGVVSVPSTAAKDTFLLEIPIAEQRQITALRLDALQQDSLPGKGPGHANGNFVVTQVQAELQSPRAAAGPAARFVRVELPGKDRLLQLAEVQVFSKGVNAALQGAASQKSTYADAVASRANDGRTAPEYHNGSVAHTADHTENPWWEVDLKSEMPLDRIVVWNRAELPDRLAGFHITALDANRKVVWEKRENPAAPQLPFDLAGVREIRFADAVADFVQAGFAVDAVVSNATTHGKSGRTARGGESGWAIGGRAGAPHFLTLLLETPLQAPPGSTLRISIEQQSPHARHTLGRFRLSASADAQVRLLGEIPAELAAVLTKKPADRSDAERSRILNHYVREMAPELSANRLKLAALQKEIAALPTTTVPIFRELPGNRHRKTHVQLRGDYLSLGAEVTAGVPAAFQPLPSGAPSNRLSLARWLVDENNPLTARVIANRYWEAIFGIGLVRTSEEFGAQGELPSHPELLDWLATELVRSGWNIKAFVRLLVTSATYRQSSRVMPGAAERDPENRLLARGPRVRLSAEMVRDQALAVSGLLSHKMFGPSVRPVRPSSGLSAAFGGGLDWQPSTGEDRFRRALYTEWRRTSPYPSMATFDAPNREVCTLRRGRTNTPLQALVTLNDPVFVEAAQALARRLTTAADPDAKLTLAFRLVLARPPSAKERQRLRLLQAQVLETFQADPKSAVAMATDPIGPVPTGAEPADLAAWTTVCGVLLNLDETLMKR